MTTRHDYKHRAAHPLPTRSPARSPSSSPASSLAVRLTLAAAFTTVSAVALLSWDDEKPGTTETALTLPEKEREDLPTLLATAGDTPENLRRLQDNLRGLGYKPSAGTFFDSGTASATMAYLKDNPNQAGSLAPWIAAHLVEHGHQETLSGLIFETPGQWEQVSTQIQVMSRNREDLSADDIRSLQGLMLVIGTYSGPADGRRNTKFKSALNDISLYFRTGDITLLQDRSVTQRNLLSQAIADSAKKLHDQWESASKNNTATLTLSDPLDDYRLSSRYGMRFLPQFDRHERLHQGIDMAAPKKTPVHVAAPGRVVSARRYAGYGNAVLVDHGFSVFSHYTHLYSFSVRPGLELEAGDSLGLVGSTGHTTGNNLHFEVLMRDSKGQAVAVNPLKLFDQNLADPEVRQAAIADARQVSSRPSGQVLDKFGL